MRIGVLTSGGDAPGMNAVVAAVAEAAERQGGAAIGFERGYEGLAERRGGPIAVAAARRFMQDAGTWLGSSRFTALRSAEGVERCLAGLAELDGLVVVGGEGSLQGARALAQRGAPIAFVPATIDNDVGGTETTLGIDSAVDYALGVIDQLRVTGRALPGRAFLLETLGGPTEHLALAVARAAAVEAVLVPGRPLDLDAVAAHLRERADSGDAVAVMSEGVGNAVELAQGLQRRAGVRVHPTILGHAQRAARPTAKDRALGRAAGEAAVALLAAGRSGFVTLRRDGAVVPRELGGNG